MRNVIFSIKTRERAGEDRTVWLVTPVRKSANLQLLQSVIHSHSQIIQWLNTEWHSCQLTCSSPQRAGRPSGQEGRASGLQGSPAAQEEFLRSNSSTWESRHQISCFSSGCWYAFLTRRQKNTSLVYHQSMSSMKEPKLSVVTVE